MTPSEHNQQLLIDLANAHKENRELRDENRRLTVDFIKKSNGFASGIAVGALLTLLVALLLSSL